MSNIDRVITITVRIKDEEAAKAIWDAHIYTDKLVAGCKVLALSEGNSIKKLAQYEEYVDEMEVKGLFSPEDTFEKWKEGQ